MPIQAPRKTLVGAIKNLLWLPCAASPLLYVEAFTFSALKAFFTILEPDPKELYHMTTGRSAVCSLKNAGSQILEANDITPGKGIRRVFKLLEVTDLSVWYLFLASVAVDGIIDWSSGLFRLAGCAGAGHPLEGYSDGFLLHGIPDAGSGWSPIEWTFPVGSRFYPASYSVLQVQPGEHWAMASTIRAWDGVGPEYPMQTRIRIAETGEVIDSDTGEKEGLFSAQHAVSWAKGSNPYSHAINVYMEHQITQPDIPHHLGFATNDSTCFMFKTGA